MHASDDNNTSYILPEVPSDSNEDYSDDEMLEFITRNTHAHELYHVVTSDCNAQAKAKVLASYVSPVTAAATLVEHLPTALPPAPPVAVAATAQNP